MAERKNIGIAVPNAKRLNDCFHELSEAIAARAAIKGDRDLWQYDYAIFPGGSEGEDRQDWNHRCGSKDVALVAVSGAVGDGHLPLWTYGPHGEAKVDRYELKELTYATFASGTYQPINRRIDCGLADSPLWVKDADWHRFMQDLWAVRYGIDWANPAPPPDTTRMPPDEQFVTLSHALTWIAFGVCMGSNQLHEVLSQDRYGKHNPQHAIREAVARLCEVGSGGKIVLRGKHREHSDDDEKRLLTGVIEPIRLSDFRQFSYLDDELRHGDGLLVWHNDDRILDFVVGNGRKDSYLQVTVNRADLLREFQPDRIAVSERERFRCGHSFTRGDPATIAPWWSVNQALAWIVTRIPSFVEYIGNLETEEPREHRSYFVQAICESQVSESDEGKAFMESRRAGWPEGTVLAHAGRELLDRILAGEICPFVRENGKGRRMQSAEFVGIGSSKLGEDWLSFDPEPLFTSSEIMAVFPAAKVDSQADKGGTVPKHRQLDHEKIRSRASALLAEQPTLKIGPAAASIISELGNNPKTGKSWDYRYIERMIAYLWRGDKVSPP